MNQHTLLIADSSEDFCIQLQGIVRWICHVETCHSGSDVLRKINEFHPEILVLDLMLPELDGLSVLKVLTASGNKPVILASTLFVSDYILEVAQKLNVDYLLVKPCDIRATAARIQEQLTRLEAVPSETDDLQIKISGLLMMMGFSVKLNGFRYLQEAIAQMILLPDQSITKELYPGGARVCHTEGSHVERSIRGAILDAWSRRDNGVWQLYFPSDEKKPTNAVFVTRIADGLRMGLRTTTHLTCIPSQTHNFSAL